MGIPLFAVGIWLSWLLLRPHHQRRRPRPREDKNVKRPRPPVAAEARTFVVHVRAYPGGMTSGGYFGRALVVDLDGPRAEVLPLPTRCCARRSAAPGSVRTCCGELAPAGRRPARAGRAARVRVLPARGHAADDEREVRRRGEVAADRPAQRRARLESLRDRRQADRPRRDRGPRRVRRSRARSWSTSDGARLERRGRPLGPARGAKPRSGCGSGSAPPIASPRSGPRASGWSASRPSRTTAATPAAAGSARCWAPSASRRSPCAPVAQVRASPTRRRARRREGPPRALVRPGHREVPRARHALSNLLTFNALSALPGRNFGQETHARSSLEDRAGRARLLRVVLDRLRADPAARKDGGSARVEYESAFALGPLVGIDDPDEVLAASRALRRARPRHDLAPAARSPGRWRRAGAAGCASATPTALLRAIERDRRPRAGLGDLLAEGSRARPRAGARRPRISRCTSRASSCPATSRARCTRWRSGSPSTRAAPTTTAPAPTRPTSRGELDRLDGGERARRRRDRDRGPRGGDGLADPVQVPARRVRRPVGRSGRRCCAPVTGWDVDGDELHDDRARHRRAPSTRSTGARAGRREEDTLPPRLLDVPLDAALRPRGGAHARAARRRWSTRITARAGWTNRPRAAMLRGLAWP